MTTAEVASRDINGDLHLYSWRVGVHTYTVVGTWRLSNQYVVISQTHIAGGEIATHIRPANVIRRRKQLDDIDGA